MSEAAEREEREFYGHRVTEKWLADLAPLGTDWQKPFLETAPYLIAIFAESYRVLPDGKKAKKSFGEIATVASAEHGPSVSGLTSASATSTATSPPTATAKESQHG